MIKQVVIAATLSVLSGVAMADANWNVTVNIPNDNAVEGGGSPPNPADPAYANKTYAFYTCDDQFCVTKNFIGQVVEDKFGVIRSQTTFSVATYPKYSFVNIEVDTSAGGPPTGLKLSATPTGVVEGNYVSTQRYTLNGDQLTVTFNPLEASAAWQTLPVQP